MDEAPAHLNRHRLLSPLRRLPPRRLSGSLSTLQCRRERS